MRKRVLELALLVLVVALLATVASEQTPETPRQSEGAIPFFNLGTETSNSLVLGLPRVTVNGVALGMTRQEVEAKLAPSKGPLKTLLLGDSDLPHSMGVYQARDGKEVSVCYSYRASRVTEVHGHTLEFDGQRLLTSVNPLTPAQLKALFGEPTARGWGPDPSLHICAPPVGGYWYESLQLSVRLGRPGGVSWGSFSLGPRRWYYRARDEEFGTRGCSHCGRVDFPESAK